MVREIIHDPIFLAQPSEEATRADAGVAADLLETLTHHASGCVGMAANMIGVRKRIIAFFDEDMPIVMFNPVITRAEGPYDTEEGCLSLTGVRKCRRYQKIKVKYQNGNMQKLTKTYEGFTAEIIQHEIDHCSGILI
ncbi:MAG: peptide deformylase [Oscillospiraceae bacterium]|mgnify:CR=1 FL=1|nr:peptide deformylase [Oscillospiraceae bacterium]